MHKATQRNHELAKVEIGVMEGARPEDLPGNAAWEDVATAETKRDVTIKLEGPDAEKAAAEGISKFGEKGIKEPRRDATALRDTTTVDSGAHNTGGRHREHASQEDPTIQEEEPEDQRFLDLFLYVMSSPVAVVHISRIKFCIGTD